VLLPLLVDTEETARLACVIDQCTDDHLSQPGYRTVEAAEALDESYPKAGFIREFEKVVTGLTPEPEPGFLEKARARWAPPE
jgi:hypothetical protein